MNANKNRDLVDKMILIIGGTGSFDHAAAKRFLENGFAGDSHLQLQRVLKQELMRQELNDPRLKFYIGDTRDRASVNSTMDSVSIGCSPSTPPWRLWLFRLLGISLDQRVEPILVLARKARPVRDQDPEACKLFYHWDASRRP